MFTFSSKWGFFANNPVHVKVQMWFSVGENWSNIAICFPDAYAYPINRTPGLPPQAGWVSVMKTTENGFIGEGDIIFTSPGSFGYIIFSEENPVYYAAEQQIIQISPSENLLQIKIGVYATGIALISLGLSVLMLPKIIEKRITRKEKGRDNL